MSWEIYVDGASSGNPGPSGAGIAIFDSEGNELHLESVYLGTMTNNMAEYEALLRALGKAAELGGQDVLVNTDSLLVASQVQGLYKIKNEVLREYVGKVKKTITLFNCFKIQYIPREKNKVADKLAKEGIKKG
jgi:ribonuclease HI